eukprot:241488-Chlamydomonas_euryale.AAC.2
MRNGMNLSTMRNGINLLDQVFSLSDSTTPNPVLGLPHPIPPSSSQMDLLNHEAVEVVRQHSAPAL